MTWDGLRQPRRRRLTLGLTLATLCGSVIPSQRHGASAGPDPYTAGDAEKIAAAGYVQVGGKMRWADHDTQAIEDVLGDLPFIWLETAHFRIGCTLPPFTVGKTHRKKLRAELKQLRTKLPTVKSNSRVLDPWLRAHLFAQRCEQIYAEFSERLGVEDGDFPEHGRQRAHPECMGVGRYLGQGDKFLLLLLNERGGFERYSRKFIKMPGEYPRRHAFGRRSSVLFGTAIGYHEALYDDTYLHCQVVRSLVANFVDGFKSYCQEVPAWWKYGLGMCFARRISPHFTDYDRIDAVEPDIRADGNWRPRVYKLVKNGGATDLDTLLRRPHCGEYRFRDYLISWSVAEFLLSRGDEDFSEFVHALKTPLYDGSSGKIPTAAEMHEHQVAALASIWGYDIESLERDWSRWVLRTQR